MTIPLSGATRPAAAAGAVPRAGARLLFVDNIRVFLTLLVITHHLMVIYAGSGSWGLYEEGREDTLTAALGTWFCAVNQAYFMGLFLLISAYFAPGSCDRKGAGRFVKDRLIRLGIPLAVYSWIISPITWYFVLRSQGVSLPWQDYLPGKMEAFLGAGPLWFVEALLLLSLAYAVWRFFRPDPPTPPVDFAAPFPRNAAIALFALLLAIVTFLVRLVFPVDYSFPLLNFQFPHFAQYIALFIVGLVAYRRNWLVGLLDATGKLWLWIAIAMILLFVPLAVLGGGLESDEPFKGGLHWQALAFALWEAFMCVGMCIVVIYLFRRYLNQQGKVAGFLSPNAYTAYIIHAPIITAIALAQRDVALYPLVKYAIAVLIAVPLTFGLSALVRKIPYVDRVVGPGGKG